MANRMRSPPTHQQQQQQMQQMHGGMPGQGCLESQYSQFNGNQGQQSQGLHPRQQSMPAAVFQGNTPPHNNMSPPPQQMQHPQQVHHMSSPPSMNTSMNMMSPPQSVQSAHNSMSPHNPHQSMSPPHQQQNQMMSPVKPGQQQQQQQSRMGQSGVLPTSPTHMAAMRGAAAASASRQFDFSGAEMGFQQQQQGFMYPTPPHMGVQGSGGQGGNPKVGAEYGMTPSPDSPGQWTSSEMSPQSHSDWSEGIHSPPSATQCYSQQQQHLQMQQQSQENGGLLI